MGMQLPRLNVSDSFANLGGSFDAQQQQAGLAQLMSEDQFKQIQALNDPTTNLALAKQTADAQAGYPNLATNVQASGVGEGILKGLGNAFSNAQQIGRYNQQVNAYKDIQNAYQQAQAQQRDLVMGQIAAQQQNTREAQGYLQAHNPQAAALFPYLDQAGRQAMLGGIGTKEINMQYKPLEGTAEGQAQVNKGQAINTAINSMPPVEVGGVPIPAQVDARRNIQGYAPTTTVDVNKGILDNQGKLISNQSAANKLGVQPQQLQQEIQKNALDIQIKQVQAQFAEQEKQLQIKRDQLANQKGTLDYKKGLDEYKRFAQGQALFKTLQESGALASNDPQKQAEMQAQLGVFGVTYNPSNAKYKTLKHKNGSVYQIDESNDTARELIDKSGKLSYGPWHGISQ